MAGLFGHHHVSSPKPVAAPAPPPQAPQTNGAMVGATQNYGNNTNKLSNQSQISRGTFLGN